MVIETNPQVSQPESPASETAAAASNDHAQAHAAGEGQQAGQQPENEGDPTGESPEKGPLDTFWTELSPEARLEFAKKLSPDEISQHPEYQEHLRRDEQKARTDGLRKQRETDRLRAEEDAIQQGHQNAEKALDDAAREGETDKLPALARKLAEAKARAEYWPSMRDDLFQAPERTSYGEQMTPEEKAAFVERQADVGAQMDHSFKVFGDAVARIATATVEEHLKGAKVKAENAAHELGKAEGLREARGEAPPRTPAGAPPAGGSDAEKLANPNTSIEELMTIRARQKGGR